MKAHSSNKTKQSVNLIDRACQKANTIVEEISIHSNIKNRMWSSLSQKLDNINKRVLSWFLISATSLSLLIAAHVSFDYAQNLHEHIPTPSIAAVPLKTNAKATMDIVKFKKLDNLEIDTEISLDNELPTQLSSITPRYENRISKQKESVITDKQNSVQVSFGTAISKIGIQPELGINIKVLEFGKENYTNLIYAGVSASFINSNTFNTGTEELKSQNISYQPALFAQAIYERKNLKNNSIWTGKLGYLINQPNHTLFKKNTIKVSVQKNIGRHVKIGPEVIITNNFNTYYPGLGITVNS